MLNLLPLALGVVAIALLAKMNKSNKVFWTFLVSLLFGYACGSAVKNYKSFTEKKVYPAYVMPTQTLDALTIEDAALLPSTSSDVRSTLCITNMDKSVGKAFKHIAGLPSRTQLTFNPEDDIGIYHPFDTS